MRGLVAACALTALGCGGAGPEPSPPRARAAVAPPPSTLTLQVVPREYRLELAVDPAADRYSGTVEIDLFQQDERRSLWLHAREVSVSRVQLRVDGRFQPAAFRRTPNGMVEISYPAAMGAGELHVRLSFEGAYAAGAHGLVRSARGGDRYAATLFEPTFARDVFPCFDDPVFRTPFRLTLIVPERAVAVSSAPVASSTVVGDGTRRVAFAPTAPLPSYLFGFAVGPFDAAEPIVLAPSDVRARPLALRMLAPRGRAHALQGVLDDAAELLPELEQYTGIAYPFDKLDFVAVPDVIVGMENPGEIVLPGWWGAVEPAERPVEWRREMRAWVAHELAHIWFGDLVTVSGWEHLWIKEGAAAWMETKLLEARHPEDDPRSALLTLVHGAMVDDETGEQPLAPTSRDDIEAQHAYGAITYDKGAALLGSFERWIGPDGFRGSLRGFLHAKALGSATSGELVVAATSSAGREVREAMASFTGAGVPLVDVRVECAGDRRELVLHQQAWLPFGAAPRSTTWKIPFCARYSSSGAMRETCALITGPDARVKLEGGECPAWVHPNADAAGYYRWSLPPEQLDRLVQNLPALTVRERLAIGDGVRAAFRRGTLGAPEAFPVLEKLAADSDRRVALSAAQLLGLVHGWFDEEPATRDAIERYGRRLYAADKARATWAAPDASAPAARAQVLRAWLFDFLAQTARDPEVRREALRRGQAWLGLGADSKLHTDAVPWDLAKISLQVAVEDGDGAVLDAVFARLGETEDDLVRRTLLRAAGRARVPELAARVWTLALDPRLRREEASLLLDAQVESDEARDAALAWVEGQAAAIERRLGRRALLALISSAGRACDERHLALLRAKLDRDHGHGDDWRTTVDAAARRIRWCIDRRAAQASGARAYFAR